MFAPSAFASFAVGDDYPPSPFAEDAAEPPVFLSLSAFNTSQVVKWTLRDDDPEAS